MSRVFLASTGSVIWVVAIIGIYHVSRVNAPQSRWNVLHWPGGMVAFLLAYLSGRTPSSDIYRYGLDLILFITGFTLLYVPGLMANTIATAQPVPVNRLNTVLVLLSLEGGAIIGLPFGFVIGGGSIPGLTGGVAILLLPLFGMAILRLAQLVNVIAARPLKT